ncbi:hypothetical protein PF005_g13750 [Phytophthora fragariae]|uniref:RxLR effector protein n=1 Tax=Phytophthora fragariae TaxID=53985 RepID=A0A6A3KJF8_9STRA|nr:hypothetical protein PF003_g134 [Phytophthora fragariae]KAE8934909.1 hypothetical protein PF009_g15121 [Phytophthora fragariae]KAE9003873.1 hypothetical protein PF011_g12718 [Phytophthora fragariae]KAE9107742.1 hypothetical protein PF007_g12925 [Phytophthora fragariae]KAE9142139.1 hypothetical protein PF006_g12734 [Phytophthora fragariae]
MGALCVVAVIFWAAVGSTAVARTLLASTARCTATLGPSVKHLSAAMGTAVATTVKTAVLADLGLAGLATALITTLPSVLR